MSDLIGAPFHVHIDRMEREYATQQSIFSLPKKQWYQPSTSSPNISSTIHGLPVGNILGPAAGPHTQMAQNLVLGWLGGARYFELKTVQINDQIHVDRPCIDAANVCYNVEWSQELTREESLNQYVQGAMLIHMLRVAPEFFHHPFGDIDWSGSRGETLFDMSIGYDLKGIQAEPMLKFMRSLMDAEHVIEELRNSIPNRYGLLRDIEYPNRIVSSATLSTFHGCPPGEIERIAEHLIGEMDLDVTIKMNPPMLGKEHLEYLLHDHMGYHDIQVPDSAYTGVQALSECVEMCKRLASFAWERGRSIGAKFTNTLEVLNHRSVFPEENVVMYLSGAPLHVIALTLVGEFRRAIGAEFSISFSAGVDRHNFADIVACGFAPITVATDLLKEGGYGRLYKYLENLASSMRDIGANTIEDYILDAKGQRDQAGSNEVKAGYANTLIIAEETRDNQRYYQQHNCKVPKKVASELRTFDCLNCGKCIPVCPNNAIFIYETPKEKINYVDLAVNADGKMIKGDEQRQFVVEENMQIAIYADFCNQCGNCDTFCPELGGPHLQKPNFFGTRESFSVKRDIDGYYFEKENTGTYTLHGRLSNQTYQLTISGVDEIFTSEQISIHFRDGEPHRIADHNSGGGEQRVDLEAYHTMRVLLQSLPNQHGITPIQVQFHGRNG